MLGLAGRKHRSRRKRRHAIVIVPAILKEACGIADVMKDAFLGDASYYKVRSWESEDRKMMVAKK
jgi:hypothetical protein